MPNAYVMFTLQVNDEDAMSEYVGAAMPTLGPAGGRLLAIGVPEEVLEGDWHGSRTAVLEFPSVDAARSWYESPGYQAAIGIRHAAAESNAALIAGLPMSNPSPLFVTPESAPKPLGIVGEELTILASGAQTGGYEIFRQVGPEGTGPPPHEHPWDESFYVIEGEVAFALGRDSERSATAGTLVHIPAGTQHWFRFGPGGGEMISMTSRQGASQLFTDLDREISAENPDLAQLVEIASSHGVEFAVPAA